MKSIKCYMLFIILLVGGMFASETVDAQAYCSIRDPDLHLKNMFPNSKSYTESIIDFRSISVDPDLIGAFPDFDIAEFGRHGIYKIYDNTQMIGTLQSISVKDRWSLTEVVIALDREGALIDYSFQRSRNKWAKSIELESVKDTLRGKGYIELLRQYSELIVDLEKKSTKSKDLLFALVIESVLKAGILFNEIADVKESSKN
jgi:hypothetical protein